MFKYELNQAVYYIEDNKLHSALVVSRCCIENKLEAYTETQKEIYEPWGKTQTLYKTVHGIYKEDQLFESKEELCDHIMNS